MVQSTPSLFIDDDTEDAPWMVMSDWQFAAVSLFHTILKSYVARLSPPLYVAAMLPIRYHPLPGDPRIQQLAPDVFVAHVAPHFRSSYCLEEEGVAPALVLEVVSHESRQRDIVDKRRAYAAMGVQEYVLFDPVGGLLTPRLQGYRRQGEHLMQWEQDSEGRLWSPVLGAGLMMVGEELRLVRPDGTLAPSISGGSRGTGAPGSSGPRASGGRGPAPARGASTTARRHPTPGPELKPGWRRACGFPLSAPEEFSADPPWTPSSVPDYNHKVCRLADGGRDHGLRERP